MSAPDFIDIPDWHEQQWLEEFQQYIQSVEEKHGCEYETMAVSVQPIYEPGERDAKI